MGYQREDGRVGTRNYIAVVAASNCAAHTAEMIARSYEGETLPPASTASWRFRTAKAAGSRWDRTGPASAHAGGVLEHPNVSAAVILGLGCEVNQIDHYLGPGGPRSNRAGRNDAAGLAAERAAPSKRRDGRSRS